MHNQRKIGVILSYISEIIKILSTLIYTPVMLRLLGQSEYGLYQLIYSFVAYLGLLSFGFSASYVRFYSKYKNRDDSEGIAKLNGLFMIVFVLIACIALLCGFIMTANIREIFGDGLKENEQEKAKTLMTWLVINMAISFPNSVFTCITSAHERFLFQRLLIVSSNILNPFLSLPLLLLGFGSIGMVIVTTAISMVHLIVNIWFVCIKMKERFIFHHFDISLLKTVWHFTFFIFLNQIIDQINWSVDRFLLGRISGTASVAIYGLGAQINTLYVMFSSSISSVFAPEVNRIVAESDDNYKLSNLFIRIGRIQFIVLYLIMSGFIFFGKSFMYFWGGAGYEESYYVALWLIVPATVPLIQNLGIEIQRAKNKHKMRSVVYLFIAMINVLASIPLIKKYGPTGASIGTAIALFFGNILFMNWYYDKAIGIDIKSFWKNIVSFFPALIIPMVFGLIVRRIRIQNLLQLIMLGISYTIVYLISVWLFGANKMEKQMVLKMCRKVKPKGYHKKK